MIINSVQYPVLMHLYNRNYEIKPKNSETLSYQHDTIELSFAGIFGDTETPINLEQAQQYSGIHCANCGGSMLSKKDFDNILAKSKEAKNAKDFLDILKENKKYIPKRFEYIIDDIEQIPNYENMSVSQLRKELGGISYLKKRQVTHEIKNYLREYAQNFDSEKSDKALKTLDDMHTKQNYVVQKEKVMQFIKDLELSDTEKNKILTKTLKPLLYTNGYFMLFYSSKMLEIPKDECGAFIMNRLFGSSLSSIVPITQYRQYKDSKNNKILICKNCESNQSKNVFWRTNNFQHLKDNMRVYLTDLAYLMGEEKMEVSYDYARNLAGISRIITKGEVDFSQSELKAIKNVRRTTKRHEHFIPIEQTQIDIPCAECGSIMLPHAKRKEIENELKECSTPYEYSQVLRKNIKYIGVNHRVLARIFLEIVKNNPQISNEDFLREFLKKESNYSDKAIKNSIDTYLNNRPYVVENYSPENLEIYDTFSKRLINYIDSGKFKDYDETKLYSVCTRDLDLKKHPVKPIFILLRNLKNISYKHLCAQQGANFGFNDKDRIYTILFHLFKYNVATADHLMPGIKGGEGDKYNLIGLCKSCNRTKSQKNVNHWYIENKNLAQHLKKQLEVIDSMAKSGQIEGYDDWAKTIAQKVYEQTYGKLDLREDFV